MMIHMMLTELQKQGVFDSCEEMNRIMNHVICQVTEHETTEKRPDTIIEQQVKAPQQQQRQGNADRNGHHEPILIVRVLVMNTVHRELKSLQEFPIRVKVEHKAMQNILEKGPEKDSGQKQPGDGF